MSFREKFTSIKMRYLRGTTWIQMLLNLGIITANLKLFENFFQNWLGLNITQMVMISIPSYIFLSYLIGALDERYGIWKHENDYQSYVVTPVIRDLANSIKKIESMVTDLLNKK